MATPDLWRGERWMLSNATSNTRLRSVTEMSAMRWYTAMGRRVWPHEIWTFLFRDRRLSEGPTVAEFWGAPQDGEEEAMSAHPARRDDAAAA